MAVVQRFLSRSRRFLVITVALMMVLSLAACSGGRGRNAEAQEFADGVLPGELRVLTTAVNWSPVAGGLIPNPHTSAVYAILDDPDAVVRVNSLHTQDLLDAVAEARLVAVQFRTLEVAMGSVGVGLVGFNAGQVYLSIDVRPDTVSANRKRLDRGLNAWQSALQQLPDDNPYGVFALHLVRSDVVLPASRDQDAPRLLQWSSSARMKALNAASEHQAFVRIDADGAEPVANSLQPALSSSQRETARRAVQAAAESVVGSPTGPVRLEQSFYLTNELDQVRMYCFLVPNGDVIAVTVSLPGMSTSEITSIDLDSVGRIPRPLEPDRIPR